jgi:hypothetical protein
MSATATLAPTLYDDWRIRRDRLAGLPTREGDRHRAELRLLEFLLEHYRGSPDAEKPARFPARTEVFVNRRAIIVHNHLGKGYLSDTHTRQQAEQRVRAVLGRMTASESTQVADRPVFDPTAPPSYDENVEAIRGRLCEGDVDARLLAIVELGQFGSLDDIGLISDLLALPPQADEDPFERHVLLIAMKRIVRRLAGKDAYERLWSGASGDTAEVYELVPSQLVWDVRTKLPPVYEPLLLSFYIEPWRAGEWIVIGDAWGSELSVNATGAVYSFDPFAEKAPQFVNSSVRQLAHFIKEHKEFIHPLRQPAEVERFRERLEAIDATAFSEAENWWEEVVERMLIQAVAAMTKLLPKVYEPLLLTFFAEPRQQDGWNVIGNDCAAEFRVDSAGVVFLFDSSGEKPMRFVNSSVKQLASFIEAHREYVHPMRVKLNQQSEIKFLRYRLEAIDANAFSDDENWWSLVIERTMLS